MYYSKLMEVKMLFRSLFLSLFLAVTLVNCVNYQPRAIPLIEDNWSDILEGEWMVEFMAPWCPACKAFTATWDEFAKGWARDLEIQVGVIDVTQSPGLSGRFLVTSLPSIYHVKDGIFRQYHGPRASTDLVSFVDGEEWKKVEPVSKWIAPDSIQMSMVGSFFKLAMKIRSFYTLMTETYGIPEWGCYLIFAVLTIMLGLLLGLILVCLCDFVMPAKMYPPPIPKELMDPARDKEGDIIDDRETQDGDVQVRRRKVPSDADEADKDTDEEDDNNTDTSTEKSKDTTEEAKKDK